MADTLAELFVVLGLKDEMSSKLSTAVTAASALSAGLYLLTQAAEGPIDAFNKLESAAEVTALQTGNTADEMQGLIEGLHSADTSLTESIDLFTALGKAGYDNVQDLKYLGDQFDTLGDATGKTGAQLVDTLIPAFKALGESVQDEVDFDRLAVMFMETNVSAEEFGTTVKRIGPNLVEAGLDLEDLEVAMVAMADSGIEGRLAISRLNDIFKENADAAKEVEEAQKEVEDAAKSLSDANDKLADSNENLLDSQDSYKDSSDKVADAEGNLAEAKLKLVEVQNNQKSSALDVLRAQNDVESASRKLESAHRDQADASRGVAEAQKEQNVAIEGVYEATDAASAAALKLSEAQKKGADSNKDGKLSNEELASSLGITVEKLTGAEQKLGDSAGKMQEYADAQNKALPVSAQFNTTLEKIGLAIGEQLQPFEGLVGAIGAFTSVTTAIATPLLLLQTVGPALQAMTGGSLLAGLGTLSASISAVGASMAAALIPALIAAAPIIIGIGIALVAIYALNELGVFDWIIDQGAAFGEWLRNFDIGAAFQGILDFFTNLPQTIMDALGGSGGGDIAGMIVSVIFPPLLIINLLNAAFPQIGEFFSSIPGKVMDFLKGLDPNLIVSVIIGVIFPPTIILSALGVNWISIGKWFADIGALVMSAISQAVIDAVEIADKILPISEILAVLIAGWEAITTWAAGIGQSLVDVIGAGFGLLLAAIKGYIAQVLTDAQTLISTVTSAITVLFSTISGLLSGFISSATETISGFISTVIDAYTIAFSTIIELLTTWISDFTTGIVAFFSDIVAKLGEWAVTMIDAYVAFWTDVLAKLMEWVTGFTDIIVLFFVDIITKLGEWIVGYIDATTKFFADIITALTEWVTGYTDIIVAFFADIIAKLTEWAAGMIAGFVQFFADVIAGVTQWGVDMLISITTGLTNILDAIGTPLQLIYNAIAQRFTDVLTFVQNIFNTIISIVNSILGAVGSVTGAQSSLPAYATGTSYVPETGIAILHKGEAVIPASQNTGTGVGGGMSVIINQLTLPGVTNYDEFKARLDQDARLSVSRRGAI